MSATNRGSQRVKNDYYATPGWVTRSILDYIDLGNNVLDPCCGDGSILREVNRYTNTMATLKGIEIDPDLARKTAINVEAVVLTGNALEIEWPRASAIIMNPPYSKAMEFVTRALEHNAKYSSSTAVLLRLNWLEGVGRAKFHIRHPADVFVLPRRPSFDGKGTDACAYAWFLWSPFRKGGTYSILPLDEE